MYKKNSKFRTTTISFPFPSFSIHSTSFPFTLVIPPSFSLYVARFSTFPSFISAVVTSPTKKLYDGDIGHSGETEWNRKCKGNRNVNFELRIPKFIKYYYLLTSDLAGTIPLGQQLKSMLWSIQRF